MRQELVNWNGKEFANVTSSREFTPKNCHTGTWQSWGINMTKYKGYIDRLIHRRRHRLIQKLSDTWSQLWPIIGMSKVCGECFKGNIGKPKNSHGCCGSCEFLGKTACVAKPVGCASFTCFALSDYIVGGSDIYTKVLKLDHDIAALVGRNFHPYFVHAFQRELAIKMTAELADKYRQAIKMVEEFISQYRGKPVKYTARFAKDIAYFEMQEAANALFKLTQGTNNVSSDNRPIA